MNTLKRTCSRYRRRPSEVGETGRYEWDRRMEDKLAPYQVAEKSVESEIGFGCALLGL